MTSPNTVPLLEVQVSPEIRERLRELAHRLGYSDSNTYVLSLIEQDAHTHGESFALGADAVEGFRQGWRDAMTGKTFPASAIWDIVNDE
jgi:predicted DNA-binding protein